MDRHIKTGDIVYFLVANLLILGFIACAYLLDAGNADLYYAVVQEDEALEWATFWAFILSAIAFAVSAGRYHASESRIPWYFVGVALFCFIVAMEEVSWLQRVAGYRPPDYFLEHNFQQEFNFHNVVDTTYRKLALTTVIIGYGVVLPLLALPAVLRRLLERLGVLAPSILLLPAFTGTAYLYIDYPLSHSGEWVEMMLGLGFLFSALPMLERFGKRTGRDGDSRVATRLTLIAFVVACGLGLATAALSRLQKDADPAIVQAATVEAQSLAEDFKAGRASSRCNLHKRVYTFVEEYGQRGLYDGRFAALTTQGLQESRAAFFLDPWNSPYWIRDRCVGARRYLFIYSFGPDRKRNSSRTEILGDDIGVHVRDD